MCLKLLFKKLFQRPKPIERKIKAEAEKRPQADLWPRGGRFSGFTFNRVKKTGNFFAYGWTKHDERIERPNP